MAGMTCCSSKGPPCNACGGLGSPPTTIQMVISGVTLCAIGSCVQGDTGVFNDAKIVSGASPDGTYCLTYDAIHSVPTTPLCWYSANLLTPVVFNVYNSSDGSCSGGVSETLTIGEIFIILSPTVVEILISDAADNYYLFSKILSGGCNLTGSYSGQATACGSFTFVGFTVRCALGYGGTATVVINGC